MTTRPTTIPYAFAEAAVAPYINTLPNTPTGSALASWQQGFPPVTMTPLSGGGSPPYGADFNGVLNAVSAGVQWAQLGGQWIYDSALSAAQSGYPVGAVLALNTNYESVINTSAGNTNDPNSGIGGATGWAPYGGLLAGTGLFGLESGSSNAYVVTTSPASTVNRNGLRVSFVATHTNTGAATLNAGGGIASLVRNDGSALVASDLVSGTLYSAVFNSATGNWVLAQAAPSQVGTVGLATAATTPSNATGVASPASAFVTSVLTITPTKSPRVVAHSSMTFSAITSGVNPQFALYYGTGTPPSVLSAPGGTLLASADIPAGAIGSAITLAVSGYFPVVTLGTTYWVALVVTTTGSGTFDYKGQPTLLMEF